MYISIPLGLEKIAKYKNRIGAWVPAKAFHNIVENFITHHLNSTSSSDSSSNSSSSSSEPNTDNDKAIVANDSSDKKSTTTEVTTTNPNIPNRIIIQSKAEEISKLNPDILLIQSLDVLVLKGMKPNKETLDLISNHIGPLEENNIKYLKFQYICNKLKMTEQVDVHVTPTS
jgi:hypothetical protein